MSQTAEILSFTDYRAYLNAHFQIAKRRNRRWSYGAWAKQLRLSSTSSLTKVLHGQRDAGPEITGKLVDYFEFDTQQSGYFRDLVQLSKLKHDARLSVLLMEKMERRHPDGAIRILSDDEFKLVSEWHYYAIRQLTRRKRFVESANWIAQQFRFRLSPTEAQNALQTLLRLGLLARDSRGRLRVATRVIDTSHGIANEALKRHHEQALLQTAEAVRTIDVSERSMVDSTLVMKLEDVPRAKEFLRNTIDEFEKLFEKDDGDSVFRFQLQLVPLTKNYSKKEEKNA